MKNVIKAIKANHTEMNTVVNSIRKQRPESGVAPTWLVDIYKKSGISEILVKL